VYYAGFRKEYSRNVLGYWPVKPGQAIGSWSLNGNHDMYTGGGPYFETMLGDSRFAPQSGASHFCLENEYWQILALDTSYEAPDWRGDKAGLYGDQAEWVARARRAASQKGGILLSHHQLFSPWEGQSDLLFRKLGPVLDEKLVKAWFWGHEHRCAIYKPMHNIEYPCLVGHAGVPVRFKGVDDYSAVQWQWNDKIDYDGNSYATLGMVVLDFNDKALDISFYNERGRKVDTGRREHLELV
jgi:3',5'-cyclic AMP phosphodiesterase CpdA